MRWYVELLSNQLSRLANTHTYIYNTCYIYKDARAPILPALISEIFTVVQRLDLALKNLSNTHGFLIAMWRLTVANPHDLIAPN